MATQQIVITRTTTRTTKTTKRGVAAIQEGIKRKPGRPKGSKDTRPRKSRSDKGKKRGAYKKSVQA